MSVTTGSLPHGQGHETTFAQLVSDELGIPYDDIEIEHSDTKGTPFGFGSYGSRSLAVGGTAIYKSVQKVVEKASCSRRTCWRRRRRTSSTRMARPG